MGYLGRQQSSSISSGANLLGSTSLNLMAMSVKISCGELKDKKQIFTGGKHLCLNFSRCRLVNCKVWEPPGCKREVVVGLDLAFLWAKRDMKPVDEIHKNSSRLHHILRQSPLFVYVHEAEHHWYLEWSNAGLMG